MIELKRITSENIDEIIALQVAESQKGFVSPNSRSIMDAHVAITNNEIAITFGIYNDNEVVGFIILTYGVREDRLMPSVSYHNYYIWHFMIDEKYQKNGYGRQAMNLLVDYMRTAPCGEATACWASYTIGNKGARKFFEKCGFHENGESVFGERVTVRPL
ncbi:MAG: GNAT family N-acetyltransferase [Treponema sp.]|nr:GNAT family N-acetyltransferase [Treponema sp.]